MNSTEQCRGEQEFALICVDSTSGELDRLFFYRIPPELRKDAEIGKRVRIPFGKGNSLKMGYIIEVRTAHGENREDIRKSTHSLEAGFHSLSSDKIKNIAAFCDDFPVLTPETLALALWMQKKYYTTLASCIRAIIPASKADGKFPGTRAKNPGRCPESHPLFEKGVAKTLTLEQEKALAVIKGNKKTLLFGVTGSGKTEVYLRAIEDVLAQGRQAIVLVPEIALTPQMQGLFFARFGAAVAVTHSRLTSGERFHIWQQARMGKISLVIGPRSAVFAPFAQLGLIVIDEEHEHTYHSETAPKYDAREVAIMRAGENEMVGDTNRFSSRGAAVVLGSATPSLETFFRAEQGEYAIARLSSRINKTLPEIHVLDMRKEMVRGNVSVFSRGFCDALTETLDAGKQAILFLNRRGYSSFVSCRWCGFVMTCDSCRVNHTYHADRHRLLCHYCGKTAALPAVCPACSSEHIRRYGTGTQKVEEEIATQFPSAKILRMDMDTTRGKHGHAKILDAFRRGEAQILIGTQMVAKGLDFPDVTMVGVVAADMSLHAGDFRAGEHTFQLLTQVAGRAGRRARPAAETVEQARPAAGTVEMCANLPHSLEAGNNGGNEAGHEGGDEGENGVQTCGRVFIQTYNPDHYAIQLAKRADYEKFYEFEMAQRRNMNYPPYSHIFSVMITGPAEREVINTLAKLSAIMEYCNGRDGKNRFEQLGLSPAFVSMAKKQFRWKLLVKSSEEAPLVAFVVYCIKKLRENDPLKNLNIHLTLNPISME